MKAFSFLILIIGLTLFTAGCASSKLTLKLDIYGEDPNVVYLTTEQLKAYERALKVAPEDIKSYARDRQELGWRIYQVYEAGFRLTLKTNPTSAELQSITNRLIQWKAYTNELASLTETAIKTTREASRTVHELGPVVLGPETIGGLRMADNAQVKQALAEVRQAMNGLTRPMTNAFEQGLVANFDAVKAAFQNKSTNANQKAWTDLLKEVDQLDRQIRSLARKGSVNMIFLSNAIDQVVEESKANATDQGGTLLVAMEKVPDKGAVAVKDWMEVSGSAPSPTANFSSRLASLTPPPDHNDVIREQDPADPVWRILSDSRNNSKWHTAFATNYFYSEGNNSVVIVRDSPIHYRVHSGDNNPTALIEGQLRISRALTDAAIQIAGTATGVKMPDLKPKPPQPDKPVSGAPAPAAGATGPAASGPATTAGDKSKEPDANAEDGKTDSLATIEATIDAEIANRNATFRSLSRSLVALRSDLERYGNDGPTRTNLLVQFESLLRAYSTIMKPEETKPAAK